LSEKTKKILIFHFEEFKNIMTMEFIILHYFTKSNIVGSYFHPNGKPCQKKESKAAGTSPFFCSQRMRSRKG
jgi:hypothetical protein